MKQFFRFLLGVMAFTISFSSCKKDHVEDPNLTEYETDLKQFEAIWNGLNTAYVLWPIETTDWDAVYERYYPIFKSMESQHDSVWAATWKEATSSLIDHHLVIRLERPTTGYRIILSPGIEEVMGRDYFHIPMSALVHYLKLFQLEMAGRFTNVVSKSVGGEVFESGILDDEIAYFYCSSFGLETLSEPFLHFKELVASNDIKAAVIDVRDNTGGSAIISNFIVSCFTKEKLYIGYNQTKMGLGRFELGPKLPWTVGSVDGVIDGQECDIPVIALTNVWSASASENTALAVKYLPQGYVVGERTFGATCSLYNDFGLFYSGTFGDSQEDVDGNWIGQGHYVYTPKYLFTGVDGTVYEGHGIDPDVECLFDQSAWNDGTDNQLECAIEFAKKKIAENGN